MTHTWKKANFTQAFQICFGLFLLLGASHRSDAMDFLEKRDCTLARPGRAPVHTSCVISGGMQGGTLDISIKTPDEKTYALDGPIDGEDGDKFLLENRPASRGNDSDEWQCYRRNDGKLELCFSKTDPDKSENKPKGFIFGAQGISHTADQQRFVRLGEVVSPQTLRQRFLGYRVRYSKGEGCLTCAIINGSDGQIEVSFAEDGRTVVDISSYDDRVHDASGNAVGSSLIKAIGSSSTKCDAGMDTTCASPTLKGLWYIVADDNQCTMSVENSQSAEIPACARIAGFRIASP